MRLSLHTPARLSRAGGINAALGGIDGGAIAVGRPFTNAYVS